ncbi:hypothetical protein [Haloarcula nitratireducens]|uniref:C2H2-type domain-containing protein n=1 Tax=Haloarcula nitratireducens TaxID=2487749 RepID=A0AAW4PEF0_9EURY|nr:hypothetical protein [Halomicroarcula nitratireducens]MBX0295617.1 hypothetical protein [Halomicroarcula nitratireducens]
MQSLTPATATDRTEETHACPLCGHELAAANDVYVHLQVSHRKSEISEALIEATVDEPDRPVVER